MKETYISYLSSNEIEKVLVDVTTNDNTNILNV